jgi:hypothetical protein
VVVVVFFLIGFIPCLIDIPIPADIDYKLVIKRKSPELEVSPILGNSKKKLQSSKVGPHLHFPILVSSFRLGADGDGSPGQLNLISSTCRLNVTQELPWPSRHVTQYSSISREIGILRSHRLTQSVV